jgi:hypothetical protein
MTSESSLSRGLINAFLATHYHVRGEPPFILKIGEPSQALASLYRLYGQECAAFLTAWNPYSEKFSDLENSAAQQKMLNELNKRELPMLPGEGKHPTEDWPGEDSFLILGINREDASSLGLEFRQNAFLWCGDDAVPELVLLR